MFEITQWELSSLTATGEGTPLTPGIHHLYVEDAMYNPENGQYSLTLSSLDRDGERSSLRWYVYNQDGTVNNRSVGTLNTLTEALTGVRKGVLLPKDVMHGLVLAEVKLSKPKEYNGEMRQYPQVYEFSAVTRSYLDAAADAVVTIDQFTLEG